jgi:hypothetical protein
MLVRAFYTFIEEMEISILLEVFRRKFCLHLLLYHYTHLIAKSGDMCCCMVPLDLLFIIFLIIILLLFTE